MPILPTWKNVSPPNNNASNALYGRSNQLISDAGKGFAGIGDIFSDRLARDNTRATDQFGTSIQNINSTEGMMQARKRLAESGINNPGQFDQQLIDREKVIAGNNFISQYAGKGPEGYQAGLQALSQSGLDFAAQQKLMQGLKDTNALMNSKSAEQQSLDAQDYAVAAADLQNTQNALQTQVDRTAENVSYDTFTEPKKQAALTNILDKADKDYEWSVLGEQSGEKLTATIIKNMDKEGANDTIINLALRMANDEHWYDDRGIDGDQFGIAVDKLIVDNIADRDKYAAEHAAAVTALNEYSLYAQTSLADKKHKTQFGSQGR